MDDSKKRIPGASGIFIQRICMADQTFSKIHSIQCHIRVEGWEDVKAKTTTEITSKAFSTADTDDKAVGDPNHTARRED